VSRDHDATVARGGNGSAEVDPAVLRAEINRIRSELGETLAALAAKTDVKARAREAVADTRVRAREAAAAVPASWVVLAAATVGAATAWLIWRAVDRRRY
jgi:type VI protein secretion system component VasF